MTNNDILRSLRHALDINDATVTEIVAKSGKITGTDQVRAWLKRDEETGYVELSDEMLCRFLDGLILTKRGLRPGGSIPEPLTRLTNNEILKKLRIALEMRDEDVTGIFQQVDFIVSKAELGSFFRMEGHRNYRICPEQVLRKFIQGLGKRKSG